MFITKQQKYKYESLKSYRKLMDGIIFRLLSNNEISSFDKERIASEWVCAQIRSFEEWVYDLTARNRLNVDEEQNSEYRKLLTIYCNENEVEPEFEASERIPGGISITTRCRENLVYKLIKDAEEGKLFPKSPFPDLNF
jgi:hypothetical protein